MPAASEPPTLQQELPQCGREPPPELCNSGGGSCIYTRMHACMRDALHAHRFMPAGSNRQRAATQENWR